MTNTDTDRLAALLHQRHIDVVPNLCYGCEQEAARLIAAGVRLDVKRFNIEPSFIQFNPVPKPSSTKKVRGKKTIDPVSDE